MFGSHSTMLKFVLCFMTLFAVTVKSKNVDFKVCGQELTQTMEKYCSGRYNSRPSIGAKRSPMNREDSRMGFHLNPNTDLDNEILLQSLDLPSNEYGAIRERRQGLYLVSNIVNDCCLNACSLRTLVSYCYEV